ncbi:MAG: hypothetical protein U0O04_01905 [Clostridia bacterium]|jgi:hypothetical protein
MEVIVKVISLNSIQIVGRSNFATDLTVKLLVQKVAEYAAIAERYEAVPLQSEQVYCPYAKVVVHATYMFKDEKSLNDFASECNK